MELSNRSRNLTTEQKTVIFHLSEKGVSQKQIASVLEVSVSCVKVHLHRKRIANALPPKVYISNKITDGRVGKKIKDIIKECPKTPYRGIKSVLEAQLGPETPLPSHSTIYRFLKDNNFKVEQLWKKPLILRAAKKIRILRRTEARRRFSQIMSQPSDAPPTTRTSG
jgi:IS30 family transposase